MLANNAMKLPDPSVTLLLFSLSKARLSLALGKLINPFRVEFPDACGGLDLVDVDTSGLAPR